MPTEDVSFIFHLQLHHHDSGHVGVSLMVCLDVRELQLRLTWWQRKHARPREWRIGRLVLVIRLDVYGIQLHYHVVGGDGVNVRHTPYMLQGDEC